ncbi:MAG: VCBS repeat-containing protein, partial [Candidatus Binatia bacterium]
MHIRHLLFATVGVGILAASGGAMAVDRCIGDCNHNGIVEIGELVRGVGIVLGRAMVTECAALDGNGDGIVHVAELVAAVSVHLNGGTALAQRFAARKYPLGTGAIDVVLADLNGDTVGDLVGALYAEKRIAIRLGRGDGRFGEAAYRTVSARTAPFRIASTDLNEDGRVDVATANGPAGSIAVMLGDGIGGLAPPAEIAVGAAVDLRSLAAGDIDGDDHVDLVAGDARSGDVIVMPGLGDGRFANATRIASGESQIQDVALSDVDRDGVLDVIAGSPASRSIVTLRGAGSGRFHPAVVSPAGGSVSRVRVADLDGDGSVDVLATSIFEGRLNVLIGDGKGGFSSRWGMTAGRDVAAAVGDVDHDGRPDIVASVSRPAAEG